MSSGGQLYLQPMDETSSAINGPFYLTNTLPIEHSDLQDSNGQVAGGGVSVYYSHILQLLFFSYSQGNDCLHCVNEIAAVSIIHRKRIFLSGGGGGGVGGGGGGLWAVSLYSRGVFDFIQSLRLVEESIMY